MPKRLVHIRDMTRTFVVGVIPRIDAVGAEMSQQQIVAIFFVPVIRPNIDHVTDFALVKKQSLSTDCCNATELCVLRREAEKLKPVISDSHYVYQLSLL